MLENLRKSPEITRIRSGRSTNSNLDIAVDVHEEDIGADIEEEGVEAEERIKNESMTRNCRSKMLDAVQQIIPRPRSVAVDEVEEVAERNPE